MDLAVFSGPLLVKAKYSFVGKNNDELCFQKNDIITITQKLDGGWWEGTLGTNTGWFPSNYVAILSGDLDADFGLHSPDLVRQNGVDTAQAKLDNKTMFRAMVLDDFIKAEQKHVAELQLLFDTHLQSLASAKVLEPSLFVSLIGNLEAVIEQQSHLLSLVEAEETKPAVEQRIGGCFMNVALDFKEVFHFYCANHPTAATVITRNRVPLTEFMELRGSNMSALISGLSLPFRHLEKYAIVLQELERTMEEFHVDRGDALRAASVFRDLVTFSTEVRKQKEQQLELLESNILELEGPVKLKTINLPSYLDLNVEFLITALAQIPVSIGQMEKMDRCVVLFQKLLILLDVNHKLNAYTFKMRFDLSAVQIRRLDQSSNPVQALELRGGELKQSVTLMFPSSSDLLRWLEAFQSHSIICTADDDSSTNVILPTVPSQYSTVVQNHISPVQKAEYSILPAPGQAEFKRSATLPHRLAPSVASGSTLNGHPRSVQKPEPLYQGGYSLRPFYSNKAFAGSRSGIGNSRLRKKGDVSDSEDVAVLQVVESYCNLGRNRNLGRSSVCNGAPQVLVADEEKLLVEVVRGDQVVVEEKTLVDTVYAIKDELTQLQEEVKNLTKMLQKEQKARRKLEEALAASKRPSSEKNITTTDALRTSIETLPN